jgi:hypothetical protein
MYGVDQCRICGAPIKPTNKHARDLQEDANRKPLIPEAEWRARGFLTSPTKAQLGAAPADGCCWPCGMKQMKLKYKYSTRRYAVMTAMVAAAAFVIYVTTYLPH